MNILSKYYIIKRSPPRGYKKIKERRLFGYDNTITNNITKFFNEYKKIELIIFGYFQSPLYFNSYKDEIIDKFKDELFSYELTETIDNKYDYIDFSQTSFIHIRGGDYFIHQNHMFDLKKYYIKSIEYLNNKYNSNLTYVIFTNDNNYTNKIINHIYKQNINFKYLIINEDTLESLYLMTQCGKGGITSNSSFSWWGSYMNEFKNEIVMPKVWYKDNTFYKELYFDNVKIMEI